MGFRLYNSLTHGLEDFEPIRPGVVRMYNCGPTVYDFAHIGNFRSFLTADLLRRAFEFSGLEVIQVMNITDVGHMTQDTLADGGGDDKMQKAVERMKEAKKAGRAEVDDPNDPYQVADYFTRAFIEDARALRLKVAAEFPNRMPKATEHVEAMIRMIERTPLPVGGGREGRGVLHRSRRRWSGVHHTGGQAASGTPITWRRYLPFYL